MTSTPTVTFVPGITRSSTFKQWLQLLQLPSFLELPDPAPLNNDFNSYSHLRSWNYQIQHLQTMTSTPTVTFVPGITRSSTSKQWLQLLQLPSFLELPDPVPPNNDFNSYSYLRSWNYQIQHLQTMTSTPTVTFVPGITRSSTSKQWLQLLQLPSFLELPDPAPPNNDFNSYSYLRSWNYQIHHLQTMTSTPTVTFVPGTTRSSTSKQWLQLLQLPSFLELPDPSPPNNDFNSYSYFRSWNYQIQHLQTMTSTPTVTFVPGITRSSTSKQWLQLLQLPSFLELPDPAPSNNDFNSYSYFRSWNYQIQHLQTMTSTPTVTFVPGITRSSTSKQWLQLLQLPSFLELPDPAPPNNDFNSYSYLRSWNYQIQHLQTMTTTPTVTFVPGITRSSTFKQWLQFLQLPSFLELPDPAPPNNDFNSYSYLRSWNYQIQHLQIMTSTPTVTFVPGITRSSTSKQWLQLLQLPSFLELPDPAPPNNDFNSYSYLRSWNYQIQHLQTMTSTPTVTFVTGIIRSSTSKQWLQLLQLLSFLELPDPAPPNNDFNSYSYLRSWNYQIQHLQTMTTTPTVTFVPGTTRSSTFKHWLQLLQLPSFLELPDPAPPNNDFNSYSYLRSWNYQIQHLQTMTSTPTVTFVPGITRSSTSKQRLQLLQSPSFLELPDPAPPNNDFNSYSYLRSWNYQIQHLQTMTSTPTVTFVPGITRSSTSKQWLQLLQLPSFL